MSEKELLYEVKPKYKIAYTIITHFWDIAVFVLVAMVLRFTASIGKCYDYCNFISNNDSSSSYYPKKKT